MSQKPRKEEFERMVCLCSVAQSCLTLCDPMDCSMPGFPVLHHVLELAQIHVHQVSDASNHLILCRPLLLLPSVLPPPWPLPVSHLFASGGQSIGASASASIFPVNIQKMVNSVKTCLSPCKMTEGSPWDLPIKSHY